MYNTCKAWRFISWFMYIHSHTNIPAYIHVCFLASQAESLALELAYALRDGISRTFHGNLHRNYCELRDCNCFSTQCQKTRGEGHIIFGRNTHVEHGHWNQQVTIKKVMSHLTSPSFYSRWRIVDCFELQVGICRFLSCLVVYYLYFNAISWPIQ